MKFLYYSIAIALSIIVLVVSPRLFVFSFVALAPSLVAFYIDRLPGKNTSITVALFNFTGLILYATDVMRGASAMTGAMDFKKLLVVYLFAALGWFIVWIVPRLTVIFIDYRNENRAAKIRKKINDLVDEWGEELKN